MKQIIKNLLKRILMNSLTDYEFFRDMYHLALGYFAIRKLQKKYGSKRHFVYFRGATGDGYIQFSLIDEYLRQNNTKDAVFVSAKKIAWLPHLQNIFRICDVEILPSITGDFVQEACLFWGKSLVDMRLPFYWEKQFGFTYNRCQVRMLPQFNFMDTYVWFSFGIDYPVKFRKPLFEEVNYMNKFFRETIGIVPHKTVFLSPEANSITHLSIWFWNSIIKELHKKGFKVLINENYFNYYRAPNFFPSYETSTVCLEQGGYFLGIRSGFCDIISTAKCKKIILYPEIKQKVDISEHRSEMEFSSLKAMGLVSENDKNLVEISTPLLKNITDKNSNISGTEEYFIALEKLYKQIMENF